MAMILKAFILFSSVLRALNFAFTTLSEASSAITDAQHTAQTEDGKPLVSFGV